MKRGTALVGMLNPFDRDGLQALAAAGLTSFALEAAPRTTRAQSMDVLSSQANIAGYKAVMIAADKYQRFFPMLMTAAGTVKAARVVILGVGVAGLAGDRDRQAAGRGDRGERRAPEREGAGRVAGRQVHRRALRNRRGEGGRRGRGRLCAADAAELARAPEGRGRQAHRPGRHRDHHRADPGPRRRRCWSPRRWCKHEARLGDRRPGRRAAAAATARSPKPAGRSSSTASRSSARPTCRRSWRPTPARCTRATCSTS